MSDPELASLPLPTRGYLLGAALVSRFKPEHLMPLDESALTIMQPSAEDRRAGLSYVIGNSHPVDLDDPAQFCWSLDGDLRRRVLDSLGSLDRIRAALHNVTGQPTTDEPLWDFFDSDPAAATPSLRALSNRRQALVWLQSYFHTDEPLRELDRQIERTGLIAPLQRLAGLGFVGRSTELEFLRHFVGVLPSPPAAEATTLVGKIVRNIGTIAASARDLWDWVTSLRSDADVLLVTAPGGMGKSALLARFLLQHWEAEPQWRTPFAFLDFDRPSLISRDMRVPLEEIGRQLSIECGVEIEVPWARREANAPGTPPAQVATVPYAEMVEASDVDRADFRKQQGREYVHGLARALHGSSFGSRPLLLVLDTLERVFRRGRHWITALDNMIMMLRTASIDVRVVASGRAFLAEQQANQALGSRKIYWRERALSELPPDAAEALLVRRGLSSDQARSTAKQIGGVPLSLCLAADYLKRRGGDPAHLSGLTRSWFLKRRLEDRVIQGNLYQRILSHVEDQEVAPLVSPGLILREITPPLIREVLAEPCGLGDVSEERAKHLFAGLAQEFTLVDDVGSNRLKHRTDVRQVMLSQMLGREQNRARQISEAAVHYYEKFSDAKNRAEELYHRLLLGEDKEVIASRWLTGVEDYLGEEIIDDIPSIPLRVFAATRLNLEVPDEEWLRQADAETWERKVTQDFEARLKLGQVREALQLVSGRAEFTPGSRLYPLVAQAFADIRDYAMAERWVDTGLQRIDNVADAVGRQTLVPLYLVRARIFEHIAERARTQPDLVAGEIELLDALWADHRGDTRVILIALLELEVLQRRDTLLRVELQRWLEGHVASVQADGGTIEPNVAIRVLPVLILGSAGPSIDAARWLIDVPGVRGALVQLLRRFAAGQLSANEKSGDKLIEQLVSRLEPDNLDTDGTGGLSNVLSVDEVTALAKAIRSSADRTREELSRVKR